MGEGDEVRLRIIPGFGLDSFRGQELEARTFDVLFSLDASAPWMAAVSEGFCPMCEVGLVPRTTGILLASGDCPCCGRGWVIDQRSDGSPYVGWGKNGPATCEHPEFHA